MIYGLNPIYQPQGISLFSLMQPLGEWKPPVTAGSLAMAKVREASVAANLGATEARYATAFDGKKRTGKALAAIMEISVCAVQRQLKKFEARGKVERLKAADTWVWKPEVVAYTAAQEAVRERYRAVMGIDWMKVSEIAAKVGDHVTLTRDVMRRPYMADMVMSRLVGCITQWRLK